MAVKGRWKGQKVGFRSLKGPLGKALFNKIVRCKRKSIALKYETANKSSGFCLEFPYLFTLILSATVYED